MKTALLNNRYRIIETLGRGGFGQTFLAVDTHMPSGRKCVIKQLQPSVQDSKMQQWVQASFQREAAILEELGEGHAQIPCLYAYFSEAETFYLVQEWIEGVTLQEKRAQQRVNLAEEEVRAILVNILPVLDYVHSRRIVHRDIKPENIILRARDGKPVLIDFGAVKEAIATVVDDRGHTAFSVAVGTPGYMPSEQAAGRPLYSSDLYSLGLTAIYLLTGKSPQQLEIDSHTGELRWRQEAPQLHSQLATVIDRAIRFHPRDRFASAREMLNALGHQAVTAPTQVVSPRRPSGVKAALPEPIRTPPRSPQVSSSTTPTQAQTAYVPPDRRTQKNNGFPGGILLLLAVISGIAFAIGFNLFASREQSQPVVSSPELIEPELIKPDSPPPEATSPKPKPKVTQPPRSEPTPERRPEIFVPESELSAEEPSPPPQPQASRGSAIPTFPTGTSENQVVAAIGEPTVKSQGYWQDSRAWLYRNIAADVDLGLLFDIDTGRLRQKEITFPPSADLDEMQTVLSQLLGGNVPQVAQQGLRRIYNRQNDLRSFEVGDLEGMIQRNQQDRIYIAVWDKDFH